MKTCLKHYFVDKVGIYTCDIWEIPDEGTEIWCTGWSRGQTIIPYGHGDCYHVNVGFSCYHCDQLIDIMLKWEQDGYKWGVENVNPSREQFIDGYWKKVEIK